jgi:hypothetical protein
VIKVKKVICRRLTILEEAAGLLARRPVIRRAAAAMVALAHRAPAEGVCLTANARTGMIPEENRATRADK